MKALGVSDDVIVGLDIGGSSTKVAIAWADSPGTVVRRFRMDTPRKDVVATLTSTVRAASSGRAVSRVGITVPGIVDGGQVLACANVPQLIGIDFRAQLPFHVIVTNDGVAAGLAEVRHGAAARATDVFTMMLGTGIAGAHFLDGTLLSGAHAQAGEVGHIRISSGNRRCSCGARGCLETVVGAPALIQEWVDRGGEASLDSLAAAIHAREGTALSLVDNAATDLAQGFLTISALLDPGLIVIGGGVATSLPQLIDIAVAQAQDLSTFHRLPGIAHAHFGPWAGAVGALIAEDPQDRAA